MSVAATTVPTIGSVVACTVTFNDIDDLEPFVVALESTFDHAGVPPALELVDCLSIDGSAQRASALAASRPWITVHALDRNLGFAGGMNHGIGRALRADTAWIWSLNADTRPAPEALAELLRGAAEAEGTGRRLAAVTPQLIRFDDQTLDACGMVLRRAWRHLDRGSEEPDDGRFGRPEWVFGGTGAATLYRRSALEDVAFPAHTPGDGHEPGLAGGFFDPAFHSYREDAELAFRLQRRGWSTLYWPAARVQHRRVTTPARRAALPAAINRHSLKNRYLLRLYHQTVGNAFGRGSIAWLRDLGIVAWVLTRERSSLGAWPWLWHHRRALVVRRRWLAARDRDRRWQRWFGLESEPFSSERALPDESPQNGAVP